MMKTSVLVEMKQRLGMCCIRGQIRPCMGDPLQAFGGKSIPPCSNVEGRVGMCLPVGKIHPQRGDL